MSAMPSNNPRVKTVKVHDIDADLGGRAPRRTARIKLFGKMWDINCNVNTFNVSQIFSGDVAAVGNFFKNITIPSQQADFVAAMAEQQDLDNERLVKIINKIMEVAAERPTKQPSDFQRPVRKQASGRKSTAR